MTRTIRRRLLGAALTALGLTLGLFRAFGGFGNELLVDGALLVILVVAGTGLYLAVTEAPGPRYRRAVGQ